jgi:hypothetical protein
MAQNFRIIDAFLDMRRRPFKVASTLEAYIDPLSANPVYDGEWLSIAGLKATRQADVHGTVALPCFPVLDWVGQYDIQATKKLTLQFPLVPFEAETRVMTITDLAEGSPLVVADTAIGSEGTKKGLKLLPATGGGTATIGFIVGLVTFVGTGLIKFVSIPHQRVVIPAS